ncbi:gluconate 2-dehydrogenase subunit 3 family protein [Ascidiimonas aurantiaca]|uniref:gluconate 2-dehydrogenase subunit 3 family protein n=1 Tax=Ascidiimonas aurantiaca TaxID=1685432 RepID=UPI0030ED9F20
MERRDALKQIGLSMGYVIATPTLLNIVQSCTSQPKWIPVNFTQEEGHVIYALTDIIIPKTDTPGAVELDVPHFIDAFVHEVFRTNTLSVFNTSKKTFIGKLRAATEQEEITTIQEEDLIPFLDKYLKITKEKERELSIKIGMHTMEDSKLPIPPEPLEEEDLVYNFLNTIRGLAILGYKAHEYVGEELLAYKPVPDEQKGCVDLQDATGGKAYSL